MRFIIAIAGCLLLAYPVYAAIGLGLALCVFSGLVCLMLTIYLWFVDTAHNLLLIKERVEDNYFTLERIERLLRK